MQAGTKNALTDIAGLYVGHAQDGALKSGVTVVTADKPFTASVAILGGAPGTRDTDLLAPDKSVSTIDALVLSGGSAFGLDACAGVMEGLRAKGRGLAVGNARVPIVPGAILFDLLNGGDKAWHNTPYPSLGRAAFENAGTDVKMGSVGAGTGATTARMKGGLGTASYVLDSGFTVAAIVAVNPMGSATTSGDRHFWAAPFEFENEFGGRGMDTKVGITLPENSLKTAADLSNTTLAIVATDAALDKAQCHRLAIAAHDGITRAIFPAHTPMDGDLVFAASTGEKRVETDGVLVELGHAAALCLARAIARGVYAAKPAPGDILPTWSQLNA